MHLSAGLLLDARERLAVILFSEEAVAVSIERVDCVPTDTMLQPLIDAYKWVMVKRSTGPQLYLMTTDEELTPIEDLISARARESGQLALRMATHFWPNWSPIVFGDNPAPVLIRLLHDAAVPTA